MTSGDSRGLKVEAKCLQDEFVLLKTAIEEAIRKGQNAVLELQNVPARGLVADTDLALTRINGSPGLVGWVDDF